jgi:pSer/pThr/pTyr-binding forkhead associated (FHA) protein
MKAELIPIDGGSPIPITKDLTVLGRREYCDVQIDHPSLSRRHCVIVKTEGLLIIRDLVTTNGTKVKGQKIRWAALLPDDKIALGSIKFKIYLGPDDVLSPSEAEARGIKFPASPVKAAAAAPTPARSKSSQAPRPSSKPNFLDSEDDMPIILDDDDEEWKNVNGSNDEIIDLE